MVYQGAHGTNYIDLSMYTYQGGKEYAQLLLARENVIRIMLHAGKHGGFF
jgi:hypothetical protein